MQNKQFDKHLTDYSIYFQKVQPFFKNTLILKNYFTIFKKCDKIYT